MDTLTKAARSKLMSKIRGDNLGPETRLAEALRHLVADRFDRNRRDLPGKPDFLIHGEKGWRFPAAVFVHGCFWHGCKKHFKLPKTRTAHWAAHIAKNQARDRRVRRQLRALAYKTRVVWEHDLKTQAAALKAAKKIIDSLWH